MKPGDSFERTLDVHMALVQKLVNTTLGYSNTRVERLSFVDYGARRFFGGFPFDTQIAIQNTATIDRIGFGKLHGYFFDCIVRFHNNNPGNLRMFYTIPGEAPTTAHVPTKEAIVVPNAKETQDNPSCTGTNGIATTMDVMGRELPCYKMGRVTYVELDGERMSLTAAKKALAGAAKKPSV